MNATISDAAVEAALSAMVSKNRSMADVMDCAGDMEAPMMRAALDAALPHLQPAKPEAVRLRDELRERTASSQWATKGEPDPHGDRYACERAALAMGDLTDDELANAVFMHGNEQPSIADLMAGKAFLPIAYLTAAKDRIRWLSRALVAAQAALAATGKQQVGENPAWRDELIREAHARGLMEGLNSPRPQQVGEAQGDGLVISDEDRAVLQRIQDALPTVGINGWAKGVEVLERLLRDSLAARQPVGQEPVVYDAGLYGSHPYFECTPEQWEGHTKGMTEKGERVLANMLAHHCLLARRDDRGWIITRFDLIRSGKPWWHVSNEGVLTYDYDPDTKARAVAAPPAQGVDLGQAIEQIAQQWDGCSYDAVGETIEIGRAIRAAGKRLADSKGAQS